MKQTSEQRAKRLLESYLNAEQQRTLDQHGFFIVRAKNGELYAITRTVRAIWFNKKGWPNTVHHAYPVGVPLYDCMLAAMLALKTSPTYFHRIACEVEWTGLIYLPDGDMQRERMVTKVDTFLLRSCLESFLQHESDLPRPQLPPLRRRWWHRRKH